MDAGVDAQLRPRVHPVLPTDDASPMVCSAGDLTGPDHHRHAPHDIQRGGAVPVWRPRANPGRSERSGARWPHAEAGVPVTSGMRSVTDERGVAVRHWGAIAGIRPAGHACSGGQAHCRPIHQSSDAIPEHASPRENGCSGCSTGGSASSAAYTPTVRAGTGGRAIRVFVDLSSGCIRWGEYSGDLAGELLAEGDYRTCVDLDALYLRATNDRTLVVDHSEWWNGDCIAVVGPADHEFIRAAS